MPNTLDTLAPCLQHGIQLFAHGAEAELGEQLMGGLAVHAARATRVPVDLQGDAGV